MVRVNIPRAGEIWWLDMQPSAGKEQTGRHAGLVLSDFKFNNATGFAFIAPITTGRNASRHNGFAVSLTGSGTGTTGIIQVDQVKSLDWRKRNGQFEQEAVPKEILTEVLEKFAPIFGLGLLEADGESGEGDE